jgi:hypothetical protein
VRSIRHPRAIIECCLRVQQRDSQSERPKKKKECLQEREAQAQLACREIDKTKQNRIMEGQNHKDFKENLNRASTPSAGTSISATIVFVCSGSGKVDVEW